LPERGNSIIVHRGGRSGEEKRASPFVFMMGVGEGKRMTRGCAFSIGEMGTADGGVEVGGGGIIQPALGGREGGGTCQFINRGRPGRERRPQLAFSKRTPVSDKIKTPMTGK